MDARPAKEGRATAKQGGKRYEYQDSIFHHCPRHALPTLGAADPDDDKLVINEEIVMVTKTTAPEHLDGALDEVMSGVAFPLGRNASDGNGRFRQSRHD